MRRISCAALGLAACAFHAGATSGGDDGGATIDTPPMFDDAGHELRVWRFDTAAEWGATGYQTVSAAIDPNGAITPSGYVIGGLVMHGYDGAALWAQADLDNTVLWSKTATVAPDGAGLWLGPRSVDFAGVANAGITNGDDFTVWMEGEVYLVQGAQQLRIDADVIAFLEIAPIGSSAFQRVAIGRATDLGFVTGNFSASADGWYPIRIAWAEGGTGGEHLYVEHAEPGSGTFKTFTRDRLRADLAGVSGALRWVYYHQIFGGAPNSTLPVPTLEPGGLLAQTSFTALPLGAGTPTDWSARWLGQFYAPAAGDYTFTATTLDGSQLALGGQANASHWTRDDDRTTATTDVVTATLAPGWNDLTFDYNQVTGAMQAGLVVTAAPEVALVGNPIPASRLRPVEPRGDRLNTRSITPASPLAVQDDSGVFSNLSLDMAGFANEVVTRVDVTVHLTTNHQNELVIQLTPPGGSPVTIRNDQGSSGGGDIYFQIPSTDAGLIGRSPVGVWVLGLADNVNGSGSNTTTLVTFHLTLHTSGGPDQVAQLGVWTSPIIDHVTRLYKIDDLDWTERVPSGVTAPEVRLRTCDAADCSDAPSWGSVLGKHQSPALVQRRYMQAQVTLHSDGTRESELQDLTVNYRRDAN